MTSREQLAWAVVATPAVIAVLLLVAPRRVVTPIALVGAFVTAVPAIVLSILAFRSLNDPVIGRWIVVDAAGALLIAVVGRRRACDSPRFAGLSRRRAQLARPAAAAVADVLRRSLRVLGRPARGHARRQPRSRVALDRGDHGGVGSARRLQRQGTGARGRLEIPRAHVARSRRRAPRDRHPRGRHPRRRHRGTLLARPGDLLVGQPERSRRVCAAPLRPGREGRLGAGAQLAPRCAFRGAASDLGAALRGAPAGCLARRVAFRARPRAGHRRSSRAGRPHLLRARLACSGGPVSLALASVEALARLLEPRAHGRHRARHRVRDAARTRGRRRSHHRPRCCQSDRLLCRDAARRARASRRGARRHRYRANASARSEA